MTKISKRVSILLKNRANNLPQAAGRLGDPGDDRSLASGPPRLPDAHRHQPQRRRRCRRLRGRPRPAALAAVRGRGRRGAVSSPGAGHRPGPVSSGREWSEPHIAGVLVHYAQPLPAHPCPRAVRVCAIWIGRRR